MPAILQLPPPIFLDDVTSLSVSLPKYEQKYLENFALMPSGRIFHFFSFTFWAMQRLQILILKFPDLFNDVQKSLMTKKKCNDEN